MKKSKLVGLFLCVSLLMISAGCSKTNSSTTGDKAAVQSTEVSTNTSQTSSDKTSEVKSTPGIMGKVTSINGSTITLALAKMPQQDATSGQKPPENQGQKPADQGQKPAQAPKSMAAPELTGETKTITIPDGVKITTGGKDNSKEVAVSSIKVGDMLEVTLKDDVVQQVRLMQAPQ